MTVNYIGGGLVSHRKAKRRHRQDITGTPAYAAVTSRALSAPRGPLLARNSTALRFVRQKKGQPLSCPSFDFAFLRNHPERSHLGQSLESGARGPSGTASWFSSTDQAPDDRAPVMPRPEVLTSTSMSAKSRAHAAETPGFSDLRRRLLAESDWVGLSSPQALSNSKYAHGTTECGLPDSFASQRAHLPQAAEKGSKSPTILRGSSILRSNDSSPAGPALDLPQSVPRSDRPVTPDAEEAVPQSEDLELLSFSSATPENDEQRLARLFTPLCISSKASSDTTEPLPGPVRPVPGNSSSLQLLAPAPVHEHLAHLHHPVTQHLVDSRMNADSPFCFDEGVTLVCERMGLGCTRLSRAQAIELIERELTLRRAGASAVPAWAWGDADALDPDEVEADEESLSGDEKVDKEEAVALELDMDALGAVSGEQGRNRGSQPLASYDTRASSLAVPLAAAPVSPPRPTSQPLHIRASPSWTSRAHCGILFAPGDMTGVMEL